MYLNLLIFFFFRFIRQQRFGDLRHAQNENRRVQRPTYQNQRTRQRRQVNTVYYYHVHRTQYLHLPLSVCVCVCFLYVRRNPFDYESTSLINAVFL